MSEVDEKCDLINISKQEREDLFYKSPDIKTGFHVGIKLIFADFTASGRPSPIIDRYIQEEVLPYYSNTHSNASCGIKMKGMIGEARDYIRQKYNLSKSHKILFSGNGATGAINHLVKSINLNNFEKINILVSSYEHYSNYLPWIELEKENKDKVNVIIIPNDENENINIKWLEGKLIELNKIKGCILNIITVTGGSNITGIFTDVKSISILVKSQNNEVRRNYLLVDNACIAPYKAFDGSLVDGMYISCHKFLGGTSTPGILIADENLFMYGKPYAPGGGCVAQANKKTIQYYDDIETKESAGTPNIVGIIRIKKIMELQDKYMKIIEHNESEITKYVHMKVSKLMSKYSKFKIIFPNMEINNRLPIIAVHIEEMHYNLITVLLNDLFGIQTRGGISCCGVFGQLMKEKYNINGWCRITFNWTMDKDEIDFILNAVEFVIKYGNLFEKFYQYDKQKNLYNYNGKTYNININNLLSKLKYL
jgi:selenocysteine lyase/cysteine desulfurase